MTLVPSPIILFKDHQLPIPPTKTRPRGREIEAF
jgi:hypothetical protein